jgi:hypothetical protein
VHCTDGNINIGRFSSTLFTPQKMLLLAFYALASACMCFCEFSFWVVKICLKMQEYQHVMKDAGEEGK